MTSKRESSKEWRRRIKGSLVKKAGGKCAICGYNKCVDALEFHHLDPSKKSFSIGKANPKHMTDEEVMNEANKCIMVCANCHREIHAGLVDPKNFI